MGHRFNVIESTKPVWVLGSQGIGKSSFAASIVMCRKAIFDWNITSIVDAHGHKNRAKSSGDAEVDKKVTIPSWLTPLSIHKHFNGQPIDFYD
ncbi:hypothetical protein [Nostoc sp.]|uniref:hypothetical protein n=1 Tax=Nostoc sp. TaxID=1180 RepID=UPI002FF954B3